MGGERRWAGREGTGGGKKRLKGERMGGGERRWGNRGVSGRWGREGMGGERRWVGVREWVGETWNGWGEGLRGWVGVWG